MHCAFIDTGTPSNERLGEVVRTWAEITFQQKKDTLLEKWQDKGRGH